MSNRLTDEKVNAIAAEYIMNGFIKSVALKAVGYTVKYAEHCGLKLFDNSRIKAEIARLMALQSIKTGITIEKIQLEHVRLQLLAEQKGDLSTATSNLSYLGKTIAAYTENIAQRQEQVVILISPPSVKKIENVPLDAENAESEVKNDIK